MAILTSQFGHICNAAGGLSLKAAEFRYLRDQFSQQTLKVPIKAHFQGSFGI